jgi:DNA modification methylase
MQPTYQSENATLYQGDNTVTLAAIEPETIDCGIDSPPYFNMSDYKHELQYGWEPTLELYLENQSKVRELQLRAFKEGGVLAVVIDNTVNNLSAVRAKGMRLKPNGWSKRRELQAGYKQKSLLDVAGFYLDMMHDVGWHPILKLVWDKTTGGRRTAFSAMTHEYVLFFVKQSKDARFDDGDLKGDRLYPNRFIPFKSSIIRCPPAHHDEHPCPFPVPLATEILKHICPPGGLVQDIYCGVGSSGLAALSIGAKYQGFDLNCRWAIAALQKEEARKVNQLELFAI